MTPPIKLIFGLVLLTTALGVAGSIPWSSKTVVDIAVADEGGAPIPGAKVSLISAPGGILAEGTTNEAGVLVLKYSPDPNTDWGKHVWRFEIYREGYVANETPVNMSEHPAGTIKAWLPNAPPGLEKPYLRFLIQSQFVCRKIS